MGASPAVGMYKLTRLISCFFLVMRSDNCWLTDCKRSCDSSVRVRDSFSVASRRDSQDPKWVVDQKGLRGKNRREFIAEHFIPNAHLALFQALPKRRHYPSSVRYITPLIVQPGNTLPSPQTCPLPLFHPPFPLLPIIRSLSLSFPYFPTLLSFPFLLGFFSISSNPRSLHPPPPSPPTCPSLPLNVRVRILAPEVLLSFFPEALHDTGQVLGMLLLCCCHLLNKFGSCVCGCVS